MVQHTQKFYEALKTIYGPAQHVVHQVKFKDGTKVIKDHEGILSRWAEHLKELLNCVDPTDPNLVDLIPELPTIPQLDHPPALYGVEVAIKGLKNNKSAGPDEFLPRFSKWRSASYPPTSSVYSPRLNHREARTAMERCHMSRPDSI